MSDQVRKDSAAQDASGDGFDDGCRGDGELKSRPSVPQGERLKHFPGDFCKALSK